MAGDGQRAPAMEYSHTRALAFLLAAQNPDGGWGYRDGGSWTEPGALAVLALAREPSAADSVRRGLKWLAGLQREDGGWPPNASIRESTSVTAPALLALSGTLPRAALEKAARWLVRQSGKESSFLYRFRRRLLRSGGVGQAFDGWPWYPGTAAWVTPSALSILALEKTRGRVPVAESDDRLESGRNFLLSRACRDGGWNHGSSRALGYEADSYPETTGLALAALRGTPAPKLRAALAAAARHLRSCRSAEGNAWLRMGLIAHSQPVAEVPLPAVRCWSVLDHAFMLLAENTSPAGHPLWNRS
jgi:hypothetical protein